MHGPSCTAAGQKARQKPALGWESVVFQPWAARVPWMGCRQARGNGGALTLAGLLQTRQQGAGSSSGEAEGLLL